MKNVLLISFLALFFFNAKAQYQSLFGENETNWNVKISQLFGDYANEIRFIKDTIVDGVNMKKVMRLVEGSSSGECFLVWEDLEMGKAWK